MTQMPGCTVTRWWHVRHAPVPNPDGTIYGALDRPADTSDAASFAALAAMLPDDAVWVISSLMRTRQTAEAIQHAAGVAKPLTVIEDLCEQCLGDWQGQPHQLVYDTLGMRHPFWLSPAETRAPGGESFVDLMARVDRAVGDLCAGHAGLDIVAVTHGGTIRACLQKALSLPAETALQFTIDNLSVTRLDQIVFDDGRAPAWRVVYVNRPPRLS